MRGERRQGERVPVDLAAAWRRAHHDVPCRVLEIGLHGLCVTIDRPVEPNQLMDLHVSLPGGPVRFLVTSRFVRDHVAGVAIFAASPEDEARWVSYFQSISHEPVRLMAR